MKQEREEQKRKKGDGGTQRQGDTPGTHKPNPSRGQQAPPKNPPPSPVDIDEDEEEETEQRRRA